MRLREREKGWDSKVGGRWRQREREGGNREVRGVGERETGEREKGQDGGGGGGGEREGENREVRGGETEGKGGGEQRGKRGGEREMGKERRGRTEKWGGG